ncbi:MAG: very short patch repair endonuclease [Akkermansiaceae bacterium]|nr:very short patch repair endonuclease [Verrucomicrobiales bacterium]
MSRIRGKDTTPEKIVRSLLRRRGYCFRLHVRIPIEGRAKLPLRPTFRAAQQRRPTFARPDIVLPKDKTAIFVHGCFWHRHSGCKNCATPTNRREWWQAKLNGNAARDKLHQAALRWPCANTGRAQAPGVCL